jgi:hypothetical protein
MERGLSAPTTSGAVSIWPCGRVQAVIEFHSAEGVEVMQFDSHALLRFLRRTYLAGAGHGWRLRGDDEGGRVGFVR